MCIRDRCAAAFVVALAAGYLQTASALKLAENNAAVADAALAVYKRQWLYLLLWNDPPSTVPLRITGLLHVGASYAISICLVLVPNPAKAALNDTALPGLIQSLLVSEDVYKRQGLC